jgi:hypothetical protein
MINAIKPSPKKRGDVVTKLKALRRCHLKAGTSFFELFGEGADDEEFESPEARQYKVIYGVRRKPPRPTSCPRAPFAFSIFCRSSQPFGSHVCYRPQMVLAGAVRLNFLFLSESLFEFISRNRCDFLPIRRLLFADTKIL